MAEAVPADSFPDGSNPCQRGTNALFQDAVRAEGLGPFEPHRGEEEIQISGIGRLLVPLLQALRTRGCKGTGRQDASVFVLPIGFRTQDLSTLTSIVLMLRSDQVRAIISDRRRPVLPMSKTMARSRTQSCCTNFWNSSGVRTSLSRRRICDVLTLLMGLNVSHSYRMA